MYINTNVKSTEISFGVNNKKKRTQKISVSQAFWHFYLHLFVFLSLSHLLFLFSTFMPFFEARFNDTSIHNSIFRFFCERT